MGSSDDLDIDLLRSVLAAENLTLVPGSRFTDDSSASFPIQGDHLGDAEFGKRRPTVAFFGASNWNTNCEAERLVTLYPKSRDRLSFISSFVIVDGKIAVGDEVRLMRGRAGPKSAVPTSFAE